ncbi:MAG TPA: hypothetical protein VJ306_18655 [Pyrinomonadaceae bacterium]|jgi:hypothetical protein|nr:hypothetical protein [Pyrinomonadaceae bacterium]
MIRKSILSLVMGVVVASALSFAVTAKAGCAGFCMNQLGNYYYAGCDISCWLNECHVTCYYIEGPPSGGDPYITE